MPGSPRLRSPGDRAAHVGFTGFSLRKAAVAFARLRPSGPHCTSASLSPTAVCGSSWSFTLRRTSRAKYGGRIGLEPFSVHLSLTLATHPVAARFYPLQGGFQLALLHGKALLQTYGHRLLLHRIHARNPAYARLIQRDGAGCGLRLRDTFKQLPQIGIQPLTKSGGVVPNHDGPWA